MNKINDFFVWLWFSGDTIEAPVDIVKIMISTVIGVWGILLILAMVIIPLILLFNL